MINPPDLGVSHVQRKLVLPLLFQPDIQKLIRNKSSSGNMIWLILVDGFPYFLVSILTGLTGMKIP